MNGRVYDPLTAQFYSPDPYVQAPGDWLNYNRYSYAFGNPFRYTDPSGEFFYIIPGISWSKSGGLSVSLSMGFGLPGAASIGLTFGYGFENNNFSASINGSLGGGYLYAGFDTKGGGMAGAGFGLGIGITGVSTNLTSLGVNWSQSGGLSGNAFGFTASASGINFDPSIGASLNYIWGENVSFSKYGIDLIEKKNSIYKNTEALCCRTIASLCCRTIAPLLPHDCIVWQVS